MNRVIFLGRIAYWSIRGFHLTENSMWGCMVLTRNDDLTQHEAFSCFLNSYSAFVLFVQSLSSLAEILEIYFNVYCMLDLIA
jgi:hypothetical protein